MGALVFALMLQAAGSTSFMVSTKAGLVNFVKGSATVKPATSVPAGRVVGTGPGGAVELLLNPGSYLRLGENTQVILNKEELYDIEITVLQGSALIESNGFTKDLPLTVNSGKLRMGIIKDGIYLFADGKAVVVEGKLVSNGTIYGKGYAISNDEGGYRARKVKTFPTALELWSQYRDSMIAAANASVAKSLRATRSSSLSSFLDVWFWYDPFASFIYLPGYRYRSPYGYTYQPVMTVSSPGNGQVNSGGGVNSGTTSGTTNAANNNSSVYRSSDVGSASVFSRGGGPAPASGGISSAGSSGGGGGHPGNPPHTVSK
jgi:hypothetical protein